jgi:hypothetical protein
MPILDYKQKGQILTITTMTMIVLLLKSLLILLY